MLSRHRFGPAMALLLGLLVLSACATGTAPVAAGPPDPNAPPDPLAQSSQTSGITVAQRAQSALEGLVMGAVIGSQAGPIGAAVGAGTMLIYAAATGHVPFGGPRRGSAGSFGGGGYTPYDEAEREAAIEAELEQQVAHADHLEDEIEAELRRQEELLSAIDDAQKAPAPTAAIAPPPEPVEVDPEQADVRIAPTAPTERKLPLAIFEKETVVIPEDTWGNDDELTLVKRSLDADRDGKPEQIRYYDKDSGKLVRVEHDTDYDGAMDTWNTYGDGELTSRVLDSNSDGDPDTWETYANGRVTERIIDRDNDGVRDAFYAYQGDSLAEERHDANNDGKIDLIITYQDRHRVSSEEDTDRDGHIDTWTKYRVVNGEEIVAEVARDTDDADDEPDVIEIYSAKDGKAMLSRREQDVNGDGHADITSIYENGKLQKREISDPSLVPM